MMKMKRILCFVATILLERVDSQYNRNNVYTCEDSSILVAYSKSGDCLDTPGCRLPECCGLTTGGNLTLTITYPAKLYAQDATIELYITGVALSTSANDPFGQMIGLPLAVPPPTLLITYSNDLCGDNPGFCPQYPGQNYTFTKTYNMPNSLLTSATLVAEFKGIVTSGSTTLLCYRGLGRLMSPAVAKLVPLLSTIG